MKQPRVKRGEKMKLLAERMRLVHQKMEQLEHDGRVLSLQGKQEESFRKTKAAKIAKEHWLKLDRTYKQLWNAERQRRSANAPKSL